MDCIRLVVVIVGLCTITGCGESATSENATATGAATNPQAPIVVNNAADPATNPVAGAAYDFLDAVLKGDTQRAGARLTPLAMQRIVAGGKQFAPPGLETASFRIGEVRTPSETQAIVQCVLTDSSSGQPRNEEMCCLMRLVENVWRVSGIAYNGGAGRPPMILDFENPPQEPQQHANSAPVAAAPGQPNTPAPPAGRPSPPRTAQEQSPAGYR